MNINFIKLVTFCCFIMHKCSAIHTFLITSSLKRKGLRDDSDFWIIDDLAYTYNGTTYQGGGQAMEYVYMILYWADGIAWINWLKNIARCHLIITP